LKNIFSNLSVEKIAGQAVTNHRIFLKQKSNSVAFFWLLGGQRQFFPIIKLIAYAKDHYFDR
jgi:hypothetical protein